MKKRKSVPKHGASTYSKVGRIKIGKPIIEWGMFSDVPKGFQKIKLDIGCGRHPQPGFVGIDIQNFDDSRIIQHDIETYPWPLPDGCVSLAIASHIAEHINPAKFGFINWMNEIWRVMEVEGKLMLALPYAGSPGYWQDPTHVNPCSENTWCYFDPLDPSKFYGFYRPKPWKIVSCAWDLQGFMEVVLSKRRMDPSYEK